MSVVRSGVGGSYRGCVDWGVDFLVSSGWDLCGRGVWCVLGAWTEICGRRGGVLYEGVLYWGITEP